jgi:hypothetical protein
MRSIYICRSTCNLKPLSSVYYGKTIDKNKVSLFELFSQRKKIMQKRNDVRRSSGAKAVVIDNRLLLMKYRLLLLLTLILGAVTALGLHFIFVH